MSKTYKIFQADTGRQVCSFEGVLDPLRKTGCTVTNGSNIISGISDVSDLFPGMGVSGPHIPQGSFIACIKGTNEIMLAASKFNATSRQWETNHANAEATNNATGAILVFHGHAGVPIVDLLALGTYRDDIEATGTVQLVTGDAPSFLSAGLVSTKGMAPYVIPSEAAYVTSGATSTQVVSAKGELKIGVDDRTAHELPRHRIEPWSRWYFVCAGGHLGHFPAMEGYAVCPGAT